MFLVLHHHARMGDREYLLHAVQILRHFTNQLNRSSFAARLLAIDRFFLTLTPGWPGGNF